MSLYQVHYCIDSKKSYRSYEASKPVSSIDEAVNLIDLLSSDEDTVYVDILDTGDKLIFNGDEGGGIFLEIDTAKGGVFSKDITAKEAKSFLKDMRIDFCELENLGFKISSI